MKALYINSTDYGCDRTITKKVTIVGYTFGADQNMSRRYGTHDAQPLAICVDKDGVFLTAHLNQLKIKHYRIPWWKLRAMITKLWKWLKDQRPSVKEFRRGRNYMFDNFPKDVDGTIWSYPPKETVQELIDNVRYLESKHFVKGAESVLGDFRYATRHDK